MNEVYITAFSSALNWVLLLHCAAMTLHIFSILSRVICCLVETIKCMGLAGTVFIPICNGKIHFVMHIGFNISLLRLLLFIFNLTKVLSIIDLSLILIFKQLHKKNSNRMIAEFIKIRNKSTIINSKKWKKQLLLKTWKFLKNLLCFFLGVTYFGFRMSPTNVKFS